MNDSLNDEIDTLRSRVSDLEADILSLRIDLQRLEDRNQRMLDALCPFADDVVMAQCSAARRFAKDD